MQIQDKIARKLHFEQSHEFAKWLTKQEQTISNTIASKILEIEVTGIFPASAKMLEDADKICELKFEFGPGYRAYYCQIGNIIYLLLNGGTKARQHQDIKRAKNIKKRELGEQA